MNNDQLADEIAEKVLRRLEDGQYLDRLIAIGEERLDVAIGKGVRRFLWYVGLLVAGAVALRLGLLEKIGAMLK